MKKTSSILFIALFLLAGNRADGQAWDKLPINAPGLSGLYYIVVTVGAYSKTLGYTVY